MKDRFPPPTACGRLGTATGAWTLLGSVSSALESRWAPSQTKFSGRDAVLSPGSRVMFLVNSTSGLSSGLLLRAPDSGPGSKSSWSLHLLDAQVSTA